MQTAPFLSVIVPVYNGERWLATALESVIAAVAVDDLEDLGGVEVLIADDGSSDSSTTHAAGFAERLPLRLLPSVRLASWVRTTNRAVDAATGVWVAFLHQDDTWLPRRLAVLRELTADADLVVTSSLFIDPAGRTLGRWSLPWSADRIEASDLARRLTVQNFLSVPSAAVRRSALAAVGPLDPTLWYTADWDLWLRLARRSRVRSSTEPTVCFRIHDAAQTVVGTVDTAELRSQLESVRQRHTWAVPDGPTRSATLRAGRAAVELNIALAALGHGQRPALRPLLRTVGAASGPSSARSLLLNSRLSERVGARVKARVRARTTT